MTLALDVAEERTGSGSGRYQVLLHLVERPTDRPKKCGRLMDAEPSSDGLRFLLCIGPT